MIDIDKLEAGQALDQLVAEKVMGWTLKKIGDHRVWGQTGWAPAGNYTTGEKVFAPSTDIAAAWEVVERLNKLHIDVDVHSNASGKKSVVAWGQVESVNSGHVLSVPLAICRAALKVVGAGT
jgi:hypothetical protein